MTLMGAMLRAASAAAAATAAGLAWAFWLVDGLGRTELRSTVASCAERDPSDAGRTCVASARDAPRGARADAAAEGRR